MNLLVKLFTYLVIVVIIVVLSMADTVKAKSLNEISDLMGMDEAPENVPEFESSNLRLRRNVNAKAAEEDDVPKDAPKEFNLRNRRQAPTPPLSESDIPKEFQEELEMMRAKRQMPSPPGEMPMPPITRTV